MDIEIRYRRGYLPKHERKELSIDDLRNFFAFIHHATRDDGFPSSEEEFRGIIRVKLEKPDTSIPVPINKLRNRDYEWTKVIAKLVERKDWIMELLLRIAMYHAEWADRHNAIEVA